MSISRRNAALLVGACVALLAAWFMLLWSPKGEELEEASARRSAAEDRAEQLEVRLARLQQSEEEAPRLLATLDRLKSAVPESPNLAQFILDANDAANAAGVDFVSIAPSPPSASATPGAPAEISLAVEITGGYFQMLDYLERLLDLPRVVVIDRIGVSPQGDQAGSPRLSVSLSARMFTTSTPSGATTTDPAAEAAGTTTTSTTLVTGSGEAVTAALDTFKDGES